MVILEKYNLFFSDPSLCDLDIGICSAYANN